DLSYCYVLHPALLSLPTLRSSDLLQLLAQLSRALIRPEFLAELRAATEPKEVSDLVMGVLDPAPEQIPATQEAPGATTGGDTAEDAAGADTAAPAASATAGSEDAPALPAITSCPTGIAHTYLAAESLETAAKDKGVELHVETQGSGGITPFTEEQIAAASALIVAADVNISGRERFAGLPLVEHPVKRAISHGPQMIDEAVAAASDPSATRVPSGGAAEEDSGSAGRQSWPRRLQGAVMTGVSYMIPFV